MADPVDLNSLVQFPWFRRAVDPRTPTTKDNETVRTGSGEFNGKEILFPTIRMIDGQLTKLSFKDAAKIAIQNKDFITFDDPDSATEASKFISNFINKSRTPIGELNLEDFMKVRNIQRQIDG